MKEEYSRKMNNCRATFLRSDTLSINIGISSGFAGWGFKILYKDKKYYTEPYYFFDAEIPGFGPTYKIVYQKLTLNKENYKVGDSLYGKLILNLLKLPKTKKVLNTLEKDILEQKCGAYNCTQQCIAKSQGGTLKLVH